jgi:hypothetical protein
MLQHCANSECSVQFPIGISQCPACGTPSLQPQEDPEPPERVWTVSRILLMVVCACVGAFPGGFWFANTRSTQAAVICGLGAAIGMGLSFPGVSLGRVLAGTGTLIMSKRSARRLISEAFNPDGSDPDEFPTDDRGRR